jgi:hypothetical protein
MTSDADFAAGAGPATRGPAANALAVALLLIAGAFVLYQPALKIGLLSDDYALLMWARRLELASRDWGQLRPLPIIAWWLVAQATAVSRTPEALHALNIALHGLNATLVAILARRMLGGPDKARPTGSQLDKARPAGSEFDKARPTGSELAPLAAGALFLTLPVAVEPVAWGSGVFDVMMTTFALLLGVVATSRRDLRPADHVACMVLTIAMIASKETGVIAGPLVILLYWTRWGRLSRGIAGLAGGLLLLAGSYTVARELTGWLDHRLVPRPDVAGIGRLVGGAGRAFLLPLHRDVIQSHPALAFATTIVLAGLLIAWAFRWRYIPRGPRLAVLVVVGTLLCIAPAIRLFGITPDLQGTRYVYLAGAWWSIAFASALLDGWTAQGRKAGKPRVTPLLAAALAAFVIAGAAAATRAHLAPWIAARAARDRVLLQLISLPPTCRQAAATGVPDNVSGAYVFRNGLNEALAPLGRSFEWVEPDRAAAECTVVVDVN